jgi:AmmeMemoRadiSam system protein A
VTDDATLLQLARDAIASRFTRSRPDPARVPDPTQGVFVTLLDARGELRGCIGHIEPIHRTLGEEIFDCAMASAFEDPRFPAVDAAELESLGIDLSLLQPPERCELSDLDPRRYGLVLTAGGRRGVLLPDLEGIDTPAQQIAIVRRKAGIRVDEPFVAERFTIRKVHG